MDYKKLAMEKHAEWKGKIEVISRAPLNTIEDLSVAYTPGVAEPCLAIQKNPELSYELTRRWNSVAVITDGTAILGLGDIGPEAGMPVMEGKCVLFKAFADIDAYPICIRSKDVEEIVRTIYLISGTFGGINIEDIGAPRCFEIERKLKEISDIPIFHDDQHGTAVVAVAAMLNACRYTKRDIKSLRAVISGAGAAAIAVCKLLIAMGLPDITLCDKQGAIYEGRDNLNSEKQYMATITNKEGHKGTLADAMKGADVFFGLSGPGLVTADMVRSMAKDPILFPMANPAPEIYPDEAKAAGAIIVGTGRSDYPNQINNVLAFPGIFRGALDVRASDINEEMKVAAAKAIAAIIPDEELREDYIMPHAFNERVVADVAKAVADAAIASGISRKK